MWSVLSAQTKLQGKHCARTYHIFDLHIFVGKVSDCVCSAADSSCLAGLLISWLANIIFMEHSDEVRDGMLVCNAGLEFRLDCEEAQDECCLLLHIVKLAR
jgi:hypothetical protein